MAPVREEIAARTARPRMSRADRRQVILDAAAEVFAERGYDTASIDEIAEAARISKPVIYDHFGSKRELHSVLLETHTEQMLTRVAERVAQAESSEDRLRAGIEAFFEFVETDTFAWRLVFREPSSDPEVAQTFQEIQGRANAGIAALVAAEPGPVSTSGWRVDAMAQMIKAMTHGLASWWYEHRETSREELVALTMDFCWIGLERLQRGESWSPQAPG